MIAQGAAKDAWRLLPADLPPSGIAAEEPRLADLANNVVYRSMLFGRRTRRSMPRVESFIGLGVVLLSSALLLSCFGPLFFFVAFPLNRFFRKPQANVIAFFGMPEALLRELIELRVPAREWSAALWGRVVSAGYRRRQSYMTLLWITLALACALLPSTSRLGLFGAALHASLFLLLGFRFGSTLGSLFRLPYAPLPALVHRVRRFRNATSLSNNPLAWIYALALVIGVFMIGLLTAVLLYAAALALQHFFPRMERIQGSVWFLPLGAVLLPLGIGLLGGALLIPLRARTARRAVEAYLGELDGEVEGMLRILRGKYDFEGDELVKVPGPRYRPSGGRPGVLPSAATAGLPATGHAAIPAAALPASPPAAAPDPPGLRRRPAQPFAAGTGEAGDDSLDPPRPAQQPAQQEPAP